MLRTTFEVEYVEDAPLGAEDVERDAFDWVPWTVTRSPGRDPVDEAANAAAEVVFEVEEEEAVDEDEDVDELSMDAGRGTAVAMADTAVVSMGGNNGAIDWGGDALLIERIGPLPPSPPLPPPPPNR